MASDGHEFQAKGPTHESFRTGSAVTSFREEFHLLSYTLCRTSMETRVLLPLSVYIARSLVIFFPLVAEVPQFLLLIAECNCCLLLSGRTLQLVILEHENVVTVFRRKHPGLSVSRSEQEHRIWIAGGLNNK